MASTTARRWIGVGLLVLGIPNPFEHGNTQHGATEYGGAQTGRTQTAQPNQGTAPRAAPAFTKKPGQTSTGAATGAKMGSQTAARMAFGMKPAPAFKPSVKPPFRATPPKPAFGKRPAPPPQEDDEIRY